MDERLLNWKRKRRAEKCPPSVLAKVHAQINSERRQEGFAWYRWAVAGMIAMLILGTFLALRTPTPSPEQLAQAQTIKDTEMSLACISVALVQASRSSGMIILKEALPSLQQGFENAKKAIIKTPSSTTSS